MSRDSGHSDDADRWVRIKALFQAALDRDGEDRGSFLDDACGDDTSVRREVERLLAADACTDEFMAAAVRPTLGPMLDEIEHARGETIGPYRLDRKLGAGGMGSVWLAERADGVFEQQVAIKLIRRGMDSAEILRRFQQERRVLARLAHPNIARLTDGGATDDGHPYFVMEYVDGEPIDSYCDRHQLSIRDRIGLFRSVCDAVGHAHRNLVVHRDLKPGNILVATGEEGAVVKLLDFGIAKLLTDDGASDAEMTAPEARLMTPRYASPEQVLGEAVSTSSDVYALGVVLYELLTGRRPYAAAGTSRRDVERAICDTAPTRPSTAIGRSPEPVRDDAGASNRIAVARRSDAARLARSLRGDLDTILLTALRKEPDRRYGSVEQLADDLRRHLESLPVLAREDTVGYRVGRFVRRNPLLVFATAAIVAISVAAAVVSSVFAYRSSVAEQRASDEAREATRQAAVATATNTFLLRLLAEADPVTNPGASELTLRQAVDRAGDIIDESFAEQPDEEAAVRFTLGVIDMNMGRLDAARTQLQRSWEIRHDLYGDDHRDTMHALAQLGLASIRMGRLDEAMTSLRPGLDSAERAGPENWDIASQIQNHVGLVHLYKGEGAEAEPHLRRAIEMATAALGASDSEVLTARHNLGGAVMMQGDLEQAIEIEKAALEARRRVRGEAHPEVAESLNTLAFYYMRSGRDDEAMELRRRTLDLRRSLYPGDHPLVAKELHNMAFLLHRMQRAEEALPYQEQAVAMWERTLDDRHPDRHRGLATLASIHDTLGRPDAAAEARRRHVALFRLSVPPDDPRLGDALGGLGVTLVEAGDLTGAEAVFREVISIAEARDDEPVSRLAGALVLLGDCLTRQERFDEAEALLLRGWTMVDEASEVPPDVRQQVLQALVAHYEAAGNAEEAERWGSELSGS